MNLEKESISKTKVAIVGMDAFFGGCNGLDAFECSIYDGVQHFISLPRNRWHGIEEQKDLLQEYGLVDGKAPVGAYITDFEIDNNESEKLTLQQLLLLKVINRALQNANVSDGENIAVIIIAETELSVWQIKDITITTVETSTFKALELAQMLLITGEVDIVVIGAVDLAGGVENILLRNQWSNINTGVNTLSYDQKVNGWMVGEGAGAVVLKPHNTAQKNSDRIYAVINAISFGQDHINVAQVCKQAFQLADIQPTEINYLEVYGSGIPQEDEAEITGLVQAYYQGKNSQDCAIGSVKANIGHTYLASGICSLIKTALCLYYKYIPATPNWSGVKTPQIWEESPFYVPTESTPWFLSKDRTRRIAAINHIGYDGSFAHLILSEEVNQKDTNYRHLQQISFYLFPIPANDYSNLLNTLACLQETIENCDSLSAAASFTFANFQRHSEAKYALAITGRNKKELLREIESAHKGINSSWEQGIDWQTPVGSYFTTKPLGKQGAIAYVSPAAVNSYVGIGRHLFRLFPQVFEDLKNNNFYNRAAEIGKKIYPTSLHKLSTRQLENFEKELLNDSSAMFETEILFSRFMTIIMRDHFQVKPKYVFGYSLGETSMMVAQGVWSNFNQGSNTFNSSLLFGDRLSGSKNAVRECWGLPKTLLSTDNFWSNYVLMASPIEAREAIQYEKLVYLTQINTPEEILIAGEPAACQRVIKTLGCNAFLAPFNYVMHCQVMRSEYEELVKLNTLPSKKNSDVVFYSAAKYQSIALDSNVIAHSIATQLSQQFDFPRLVNHVYNDGARIFIEVGAGNLCSRWIDKILENKEHMTVSLNRRGIDDHVSLIKALAKLISHRVAMDLSPLYSIPE